MRSHRFRCGTSRALAAKAIETSCDYWFGPHDGRSVTGRVGREQRSCAARRGPRTFRCGEGGLMAQGFVALLGRSSADTYPRWEQAACRPTGYAPLTRRPSTHRSHEAPPPRCPRDRRPPESATRGHYSCTITGSPILTVLKYHSAAAGIRLMQPWLTFANPIDWTAHGAECT